MDMIRITTRWTGFQGAPGFSNFFFAGGGGFIGDHNQVADRVANALLPLGPFLPTGVRVGVEPEAAIIDSDTGALTEYREIDDPSGVLGNGSGGYSAASGAVVNWRTNDVRFNRRIRGRTFIVPLGGNAYQDDGTLTPGARENMQEFAADMIGGDIDSEFGVWSRPRDGAGGVFATVVSSTVPDMAAVLRSRRD